MLRISVNHLNSPSDRSLQRLFDPPLEPSSLWIYSIKVFEALAEPRGCPGPLKCLSRRCRDPDLALAFDLNGLDDRAGAKDKIQEGAWVIFPVPPFFRT